MFSTIFLFVIISFYFILGVPIYTVNKEFYNAIEVKHSKFKAYIVPFSDFKRYNQRLREQNPKANHVVWAYRHFNEHFQIVENSSDDGEPKNSSAPPILNVLRGKELVECAVLVVRYFGGVKLGVGGLVRAYKSAALEVVDKSKLVAFEHKKRVDFFVNYSDFSKVEYILEGFDVEFTQKEFGAKGVEAQILTMHSQTSAIVGQLTPIVQSIKEWDKE